MRNGKPHFFSCVAGRFQPALVFESSLGWQIVWNTLQNGGFDAWILREPMQSQWIHKTPPTLKKVTKRTARIRQKRDRFTEMTFALVTWLANTLKKQFSKAQCFLIPWHQRHPKQSSYAFNELLKQLEKWGRPVRLTQHNAKPFGLNRSVVFLSGALCFHLRVQDKMEEFLAPANDMQGAVLVLDS